MGAAFKAEYTKEKADLTTALLILQYNDAIRGTATPTVADSKTLWQWYHAAPAAQRAEAQKFLEQGEKDNLVRETALSSIATQTKDAFKGAADKAGIEADAVALQGLLGSTEPAVTETKKAWTSLKTLNTADKEKVLDHAGVQLYDKWVAFYAKKAKGTLDGDYAKLMQSLAETLQDHKPANDNVFGETNQYVYSRVPAAIQSKLRAYLLEKLKATL